jgi:hypothetical protein
MYFFFKMKSYIFLATYSLPKVAKIRIFLFKKKYKKRTDIIDMFFSSSFFFFLSNIVYGIRRKGRCTSSRSGDLEKGPVYPARSGKIWRKGRCIRRDLRRIFVQLVVEIRREYPRHRSTKIPTSKIPIWPRMSRKHQKKPTTPGTNKKDKKKNY